MPCHDCCCMHNLPLFNSPRLWDLSCMSCQFSHLLYLVVSYHQGRRLNAAPHANSYIKCYKSHRLPAARNNQCWCIERWRAREQTCASDRIWYDSRMGESLKEASTSRIQRY